MAEPAVTPLSLSPLAWWRGESVVGNPISQITDKGTNGYHFTGSDRPDVGPVTSLSQGWPLRGRATMRFGGADLMGTVPVTPWRSLHNGAGGTLAFVFDPRGTGDAQYIFHTSGLSLATTGFALLYDGALERVILYLVNSVQSVFKLTGLSLPSRIASFPGSVKRDRPCVLIYRLGTSATAQVEVRCNGAAILLDKIGEDAATQAEVVLAAGDSTNPLYVGGRNGSGDHATMDLADGAAYARRFSDTECDEFEHYASLYYGIALDSSRKGLIVFDGNSMTMHTSDGGQATNWPHGVRLRRPFVGRNIGVPSLTTFQGLAIGQATLATRRARHVDPFWSSRRDFNVYVAWELTNDYTLALNAATTAANMKAHCQAVRAAMPTGGKIVVVGMLPRGGIAYSTVQSVNAAIRNDPSWYDEFVDVETLGIGANGAQNDTTLFNVDTVHLVAGGEAQLNPAVSAKINAALR